MSDLERRLSEALVEGAHDAPSSLGLAEAVRTRARGKRRNRLSAAVAAVALCVGVPTAVVATRGSGDEPARTPSDQSVAKDPNAGASSGLPGGFHYESWHDVTVEVPDSWTYGAPGAWCAGGGELDPPRVGRPEDVGESIACSPAFGYGVTFQTIQNKDDFEWPLTQQDPDTWPADAYVGARGLDGILVQVALPDVALAQQILDSAQRNASLDPNGCPIDTSSDPVVPGGSMTVCGYDYKGTLVQSELLRGDDVQAADEALRSAPEGGENVCDRRRGPYVGEIRMSSAAEDAKIDLGCGRRLVRQGGFQKVTPDVLYWALSPGWSGTVPGGVSLPAELRRR
jgi:hypothetical protein